MEQLICNKCKKEINSLFNKEKICRDCANERWRKNRNIRKENGTLKVTIMSSEYTSIKNKRWSLNNKEKSRIYAREARIRNPIKAKARSLLNMAVQKGSIIRRNCIVCGSAKSEGHHPDYNKPLDVVWLCRTHHIQEHKKSATELNP